MWIGLGCGIAAFAALFWVGQTLPQDAPTIEISPQGLSFREPAPVAQAANINGLVSEVVPLWNRHVTLAQGQMSRNAIDQSLAQRFASLAQRLSSSSAAGKSGSDSTALQTIREAEDGLRGIIDTLNTTQDFRSAAGQRSRQTWLRIPTPCARWLKRSQTSPSKPICWH